MLTATRTNHTFNELCTRCARWLHINAYHKLCVQYTDTDTEHACVVCLASVEAGIPHVHPQATLLSTHRSDLQKYIL